MSGRASVWLAAWKDRIRYQRQLRVLATCWFAARKYPAVLGIDPAGSCNLQCGFCGPARQRAAGAAGGLMPFPLFERIIGESVAHGRRAMLILHNWGEPLLNPALPDMIDHARQRRAAHTTQLATNGTLLNEETARRLIAARLDALVVSIDAATASDYAARKGKDVLTLVTENVRTLQRLKRMLRSAVPRVSAKIVRRPGGEAEQQAFRAQWRNLADHVQITPFSNWGGTIADEPSVPLPARRYACHFLWFYPAINWDGTVSCCCASCTPDGIIGNLADETLAAIWHGDRLREIRRRHLAGEFAAVPACSGCTYWAESGVNLDCWLRRCG